MNPHTAQSCGITVLRIVLLSESGPNYTAPMPINDGLDNDLYSDTIPINRLITSSECN